LPPSLLEEFDSAVEALGLDRSKAVQQAMRTFLGEYRWSYQPAALAVGALVVVYDHEVKGLGDMITDVQHEMKGLITSSMHVHLDERRCLEIVAVRGQVEEIKRLAEGLSARRGVEQLRSAVIPMT